MATFGWIVFVLIVVSVIFSLIGAAYERVKEYFVPTSLYLPPPDQTRLYKTDYEIRMERLRRREARVRRRERELFDLY